MDDTKYGILAFISLVGLIISMFGSVSNAVGVGMMVVSNGLAVSIASKKKCVRNNPPAKTAVAEETKI